MYFGKPRLVTVDSKTYDLPWRRWLKLWRDLNAEGDPLPPFIDLVKKYSQSHRHYHTMEHVQQCLNEFNSALSQQFIQPELIQCAIWFHDAVYVLGGSDSEMASAEYAKEVLTTAKVWKQNVNTIAGFILDTKHSRRSSGPYGDMVRDLDLSIFGQKADVFDEYERRVAAEWVPSEVTPKFFCEQRAEILRGFLAKKRIYSTRYFIWDYERRARANLERSIAQLEKGILPSSQC